MQLWKTIHFRENVYILVLYLKTFYNQVVYMNLNHKHVHNKTTIPMFLGLCIKSMSSTYTKTYKK